MKTLYDMHLVYFLLSNFIQILNFFSKLIYSVQVNKQIVGPFHIPGLILAIVGDLSAVGDLFYSLQ